MDNRLDLIDRYIAEVGKDLPRKNHLDIEAEILTAIEDMLAERSRKNGKPVDEEMTIEVLKAYGAPRKVAASYHPERYVIGPRLYSSFLTVVQVILPIVAAASLVKLGVSLGQLELTFENIFEAIFLGIAEFLGSAFTAMGGILVLFTIVQRFLPEFKEETGAWDPSQLPKVTRRNRIDIGGAILEIFGAGLAIVVFNFFPQLVNIGYHANGSWWIGFIAVESDSVWSSTILSDAFFGYLPALTILWSLTILLDAALLSRGRWETWSRWSVFGLKVLTIALAGIMLAGPALVEISAEALIAAGFPNPLAAKLLVNFAQQSAILALVITIIVSIFTAGRLLIRLTGRNLSSTLEKVAHP
jgi:hypothetical protein